MTTASLVRFAIAVATALGIESSFAVATGAVAPSSPLLIKGGRFTPLFGLEKNQVDVAVAPFRIDPLPVTNSDFSKFLEKHPEWSAGRTPRLYADSGYLKHWKDPKHGAKRRHARTPVTNVSWFAATAYCESKRGRLPTILEWEFVGAADEVKPNALKDPAFAARILAWYSSPFEIDKLSGVGRGKPNFYGIHDLHGGVWEWTHDFNSVFVSGDNRQDGDKNANFFCGNGSTDSANREDYAAFMRYAMRSSLNAEFTTSNLGFRCAYDVPEQGEKK